MFDSVAQLQLLEPGMREFPAQHTGFLCVRGETAEYSETWRSDVVMFLVLSLWP